MKKDYKRFEWYNYHRWAKRKNKLKREWIEYIETYDRNPRKDEIVRLSINDTTAVSLFLRDG